MNTQETVIQLKELKLKGMANTLESLMTLPVQSRPSFDFAIAKMVEAEILERKERKTEMFLKTSKLLDKAENRPNVCCIPTNEYVRGAEAFSNI